MPVIARYDFDEPEGPYLHDSSPAAGDQLGWYAGGAVPQDGQLVLNGTDAFAKLFQDNTFQMPRGTLEFQFSPASTRDVPQTLVSRDSEGNTPGAFRIELMPDGTIRFTHETGAEPFELATPAGFVSPGDEVQVSYSWDQGGSGGRATAINLTTGEEFAATVPPGLSMDMGGDNPHWLFGAGQQQVVPGGLEGIDQFFHGSFSYVEFSNSVDNGPVVPCFTAGTLIATPEGLRAVEELRPGDRVITRDHGAQRVLWVGQRRLDSADLVSMPALRPIRLRRGALGAGLPEQDLLVSPNHRMLVAAADNELNFGTSEVLVAAKLLVNGESIVAVGPEPVTYVHILFARHELVMAAGCWSESFQPGAQVIGSLGDAQRHEILQLFPELEQAPEEGFAIARRALRRQEAALLTG